MPSGLFITFEGGEGAGKSTQIKLLSQKLLESGREVLCTREPGGSESSEILRQILVNGEAGRWLPKSELLLHLAARFEHVERTIKPALAEGKIVICDRFIDSTVAYQAYGHGIGVEFVETLQNLIIGNFLPDITFYLNISPNVGIERTSERASSENRYENMGMSFHEKVEEGFSYICRNTPGRIKLIDANASIADISAVIYQLISKQLSGKV